MLIKCGAVSAGDVVCSGVRRQPYSTCHGRMNALHLLLSSFYFDEFILFFFDVHFIERQHTDERCDVGIVLVCLSVCPSVTLWYCAKTVVHIISLLSPPGRPITLVFLSELALRHSAGITFSEGVEYTWVQKNCSSRPISPHVLRGKPIITMDR